MNNVFEVVDNNTFERKDFFLNVANINHQFVIALAKDKIYCLAGDCLKTDMNDFYKDKNEENARFVATIQSAVNSIDSLAPLYQDSFYIYYICRGNQLFLYGIDKTDYNHFIYCSDPRFSDSVKYYNCNKRDRIRLKHFGEIYKNSRTDSLSPPYINMGSTW